jgi:hypothetical protein
LPLRPHGKESRGKQSNQSKTRQRWCGHVWLFDEGAAFPGFPGAGLRLYLSGVLLSLIILSLSTDLGASQDGWR